MHRGKGAQAYKTAERRWLFPVGVGTDAVAAIAAAVMAAAAAAVPPPFSWAQGVYRAEKGSALETPPSQTRTCYVPAS